MQSIPKPKSARDQLQNIIDDWDASGKPKTSAYWRLLSELEGANVDP